MKPPKRSIAFLRWFCRTDCVEEIEGDLMEVFIEDYRVSPVKAKLKLLWRVIRYIRPEFIKPFRKINQPQSRDMFKSYFKIGWRTLLRNKAYSFINIGGLALGMAVAILIGLWVYDELTFDSFHANRNRIAQVIQHEINNDEIVIRQGVPAVMGEELRNVYGTDFKQVVQSTWNEDQTLALGDKIINVPGSCMEPGIVDMLGLKFIQGSKDGLKNTNAIALSASVAKAIFGDANPINKMMRSNNTSDVQVVGVYEDLPENSSFKDLKVLLTWDLFVSERPWIKEMKMPWRSLFTQAFVQIADKADMKQVSEKIKNVRYDHLSDADKSYKTVVFLYPMSDWHLLSEFKNGVASGGRIDNVWLFGITGVFVLMLACINFMNLSTARSERRAKEVGIRKSIGSARSQLVAQFFSESIMVSFFAFFFALIIVMLMLPKFNEVADKHVSILWNEPMFWIAGIGFTIFTGLLAGLYPALLLSSFQPVKVLKGIFAGGQYASLPRKMLVVVQFTISITLMTGSMVVYKQVQHGQNRPLGYQRNGLINIDWTRERHKHFDVIRAELKSERIIDEIAESGSPITDSWVINDGFDWEGKDPNLPVDFPNNGVSQEYGKTIGWRVKEGRDFSREFASDSSAFILNEAAAKFIGLKDPVGKTIRWRDKPYTIIGVVENLVVKSPYGEVRPATFYLHRNNNLNVAIARLNPEVNVHDAMSRIESVFKKYDSTSPFHASFVDDEFNSKFGNEKRVGTLAAFFATFAIIISCLGLFGLASFVAEQRTKEIGIRKVLGASVAKLWTMLSTDFVVLVIISCSISIPVGYYFLNKWLMGFDYRTDMPWWIFGVACFGAVFITLLTVSFQIVKAAGRNPVRSLRSE